MTPVLVTRAEPGASRTLERLEALGFAPVNAATARIVFCSPEIRLAPGEALALTSPNGARAAARFTEDRTATVFAVGEASAEAAREEGFVQILSAGGDGAALAALILERWAGPVLHVRGRDLSFDLCSELGRAGIAARSVIGYAAEPVAALSEAARAALMARAVILIHSPKGAERFVDLAVKSGAEAALPGVRAAAISAAAAAPLERAGVTGIEVADTPDEAALIEALRRALR
jgi:uroporphyrinogen-III synthase